MGKTNHNDHFHLILGFDRLVRLLGSGLFQSSKLQGANTLYQTSTWLQTTKRSDHNWIRWAQRLPHLRLLHGPGYWKRLERKPHQLLSMNRLTGSNSQREDPNGRLNANLGYCLGIFCNSAVVLKCNIIIYLVRVVRCPCTIGSSYNGQLMQRIAIVFSLRIKLTM